MFLRTELITQIMQRLDVALDVEQGCAQLVGDVADETALRGVQFHLPREVLHRDGDALERFAAGITNGLHHDAQGAGRFADAAAQVFTVGSAGEQQIQRCMQLDRQEVRQFLHQLLRFQVAALPAEQPAGGGIGQHDPTFLIEKDGAIGHGGDQ